MKCMLTVSGEIAIELTWNTNSEDLSARLKDTRAGLQISQGNIDYILAQDYYFTNFGGFSIIHTISREGVAVLAKKLQHGPRKSFFTKLSTNHNIFRRNNLWLMLLTGQNLM